MYFEPGSRTLPENLEEMSCLKMFLTLIDCQGLRGRMSYYYREGSLNPSCRVEKDNLSLCFRLSRLRMKDKIAAQQALDEVRAQRQQELDQLDQNHVWTQKERPGLYIGPDFRELPPTGVISDGVDWAQVVSLSSPGDDGDVDFGDDFDEEVDDWDRPPQGENVSTPKLS